MKFAGAGLLRRCLTATNNKSNENGSIYGWRQDESDGAAARRGESGAGHYDR
jgi:hypothetical protein